MTGSSSLTASWTASATAAATPSTTPTSTSTSSHTPTSTASTTRLSVSPTSSNTPLPAWLSASLNAPAVNPATATGNGYVWTLFPLGVAYQGPTADAADPLTVGTWTTVSYALDAQCESGYRYYELGYTYGAAGAACSASNAPAGARNAVVSLQCATGAPGLAYVSESPTCNYHLALAINCAGNTVAPGTLCVSPSLVTATPTPTAASNNVCVAGALDVGVTLRCPHAGTVITSIPFASFGTPTGTTCSNFGLGACNAVTSAAVVASICVGLPECYVPPTLALYGGAWQGGGRRGRRMRAYRARAWLLVQHRSIQRPPSPIGHAMLGR